MSLKKNKEQNKPVEVTEEIKVEEVVETPVEPVIEEVKPTKYTIGKNYKLGGTNLFIRIAPAGEKSKFDTLPEKVKKLAYKDTDGSAILKRGSRIKVLAEKSNDNQTWIQFEGGYILASTSTKEYLEV